MKRPSIATQSSGQFLDGGCLKEHSQGQRLVQRLPNAMHEPRSQQRMTAQLEEVVTNADRLPAQNIFPDSDQLHLEGVGSRRDFLRSRFGARLRQSSTIDFSVRG